MATEDGSGIAVAIVVAENETFVSSPPSLEMIRVPSVPP
jgi:hypothetical protein